MADAKKSSIGGKTTCHLVNIKQPDRVFKKLKLSFARTRATVTMLKANRSVEASLSFLDLSESGTGLFTSELLLKGSTVELCITEPHLLRVRAVVAWSIPKTSGLHLQPFGFRSGFQFVAENEVQRVAIAEFIRKVNTDPIEAMRASVNANQSAGGAIDLNATGEVAAPAKALSVDEMMAMEAGLSEESTAAPEASAEAAPEASAAPLEAVAEAAPAEASSEAPAEVPAEEEPQAA